MQTIPEVHPSLNCLRRFFLPVLERMAFYFYVLLTALCRCVPVRRRRRLVLSLFALPHARGIDISRNHIA
jgi:hypothetical protein